jgi:lactococcin 972 family bacteriocin
MKMRTAVASIVAGVGLSVALASGGALATTQTAEGGTFSYGVGTSPCAAAYTCSQYLHPTRTHNATACGSLASSCASAPWTGAGSWAKVNILKYASGNRAYYNLK